MDYFFLVLKIKDTSEGERIHKRFELIKEFIDSEKEYYNTLMYMNKVYYFFFEFIYIGFLYLFYF